MKMQLKLSGIIMGRVIQMSMSDKDLYHYGVKGMKWGVRRTQEQLGRIKKSLRGIDDELNEIDRFVPFINKKQREVFKDFWIKDKIRRNKSYDEYNDDKDIKIRKGTKFARTSTKDKDDMSDKLYVSYKPSDNDRYTSIMPVLSKLITGRGICNMYKNTYVSDLPVVSPSEKKRIDTFVETIKTDKESLKVFTEYASRFNDGPDKLTSEQIMKEITDPKTKNYAVGRYYVKFQDQFFKNNTLNSEYTKRIIDKGYNAIVDDNDKDALSKTPIILLDTSNIKQVSSKVLSEKDVNDSINRSHKRLKNSSG